MCCQGQLSLPLPASLAASALPKTPEVAKSKDSEKQSVLHCQEIASISGKCSLAAAFKPSQDNSQPSISGARYLLGSLFLMICSFRCLLVHLKPKARREVLWDSLEDAGITPNEQSIYSGIKVICDDWCRASGLQLKHSWNCEEGASPKAWLSWQFKQMKHTASVQMGLCEGGFQFGLIWHYEEGNTGFYLLINPFRRKNPPEHHLFSFSPNATIQLCKYSNKPGRACQKIGC